jgi:sugar (pentulose or hexulose) kinase
MKILSVDVGTTAMKIGLFAEDGDGLKPVGQLSRDYAINTYNDGLFSDIESQKWQQAFVSGCKEISIEMSLKKSIHVSGGAVNPALLRAKKKWMRNCRYTFETESSMKGAALLGQKYLNRGSRSSSPE